MNERPLSGRRGGVQGPPWITSMSTQASMSPSATLKHKENSMHTVTGSERRLSGWFENSVRRLEVDILAFDGSMIHLILTHMTAIVPFFLPCSSPTPA